MDMDEKKEFLNNLVNRYLWNYSLLLNLLFLPFYQPHQPFWIALGCVFALIGKMQGLGFKLQNHIALLDIKRAWTNKKVFLIRIAVSCLAVMQIWLSWNAETNGWVCGSFCLNSEIVQKIFLSGAYSMDFYFLFILIIDLNKLKESI